ncbi:MAG: hypothetical protein PWP23_2844 [Candidatus Sumerlaeota bacterium]|nr:hypothetical protein [Candidatus Sumerlaeota bacterium]
MLRKRPLGSTGLNVTEIGFGALEIGRDWAPDVNADPSHLSCEQAGRVLNGLLDLGINFIDTAPAYYRSEEFIGSTIAHRRDEYVLATKVGEHWEPSGSYYDYSREATLRFIDRSLERLRTDRIDLIQIHSASMEVLERGETLGALQEARDAGKVLHIGMTGGVAEGVRALEIGGYETVQVPYNLLNLAAEERLLALAREKKAGVILMRGLAGGKLTEKFERLEKAEAREAIRGFVPFTPSGKAEELAGLALCFVLSSPEVSTVIAGSRRLEAVEANVRSVETGLDAAVAERLRAHARGLAVSVW